MKIGTIRKGVKVELNCGDCFALMKYKFWYRLTSAIAVADQSTASSSSSGQMNDMPTSMSPVLVPPVITTSTISAPAIAVAGQSTASSSSSSSGQIIKVEPITIDSDSDDSDEKPKVQLRESCRFGFGCRDQSNVHRRKKAHPGDDDYTVPPFPPVNVQPGAPMCPYGARCLRRNLEHFQSFTHPKRK